ncbi:glycosyltransferase family 2 protein [Pseudodesulfovibrio sp.]|uniref:glycosyltransferase family 2 protein n=1 Tax=unclassified Pseudodesulfovibrio TaxID=2661612 RepID=UPI003B00E082
MTDAAARPLTLLWESLPEPILDRLRLGFTGKRHLLDLAGRVLESGDPILRAIGSDALCTAFAENPLDGALAADLLAIDTTRALIPEPTRAVMRAVADNWQRPDAPDYFALLPERDFPAILRRIEQGVAAEPNNLFWREQAFSLGLIDNAPDWVEAQTSLPLLSGIEPVRDNVAASIALHKGRHHEAARLFEATGEAFGPCYAAMRSGLAMLTAGDSGSAHLLLLQTLARAPWNASLLLRVHDLLAGWDAQQKPLNGSVAILLYSWNKAVELDATLRSLFESELSGASVFVLDNGSTDQTPDILESWQARFENHLGKGRFTSIRLPVNIGAPAARNWLMQLDAVTRHDFACYLDDDVILPQDWLLRLGSAVLQYPDAGVWGCKVSDHANPAMIQSADAHLLADPDEPPSDLTHTEPNPFRLSNLHIQTFDTGLFDFMRPCASVTGCCHLFRTPALLASGGFALQLSPTQYDDMEHDLRLCEAGTFAVYQGHLTVHHKKRSGAASRVAGPAMGNALANKYKMQTMHDRQAILDATRREQELLAADLHHKCRVVEQALLQWAE